MIGPLGLAYAPSLPGIARRKTRVNALMTRQSIALSEAFLSDGEARA
jgi:hypothetical protein